MSNNDAVTYRPVVWDDLDMITAAFDRVWPQEGDLAGTSTGMLLARYNVLHYLSLSTSGQIAQVMNGVGFNEEHDGEFAGVCLVRVFGRPQLFPQAREAMEQTRSLIEANPKGKLALYALEDVFWRNERYLEENSDANNKERNQAELELFMVSPDVRGMGVGGTLWRNMVSMMRDNDVRAFFLHTGSDCDYGFYEYHGLERTAERLHADHAEDDDTPYLNPSDMFIYRGETARL